MICHKVRKNTNHVQSCKIVFMVRFIMPPYNGGRSIWVLFIGQVTIVSIG